MVIGTESIIQSCARLVSNAIIVNDCTVKCCINYDVQKDIEDDVILMAALKRIADENNEYDIKVTQFVFNKKYLIICKLHYRIIKPIKHVYLLTNYYY